MRNLAIRGTMLGASGGGVPTARDYVQGGLIAMWDGIENAGWGVHNPNITAWKDLVGGYGDADFIGSTTVVADNYISFRNTNGNGGAIVRGLNISFPRDMTIEIVTQIKASTSASSLPLRFEKTTGGYQKMPVYIYGTPKTYFDTWNGNGLIAPNAFLYSKVSNGVSSLAVSNSGSAYKTYQDGLLFNTPNPKADSSSTVGELWFSYYGSYTGKIFWDMYCVRVYNRTLTAAEITANYAIDKARFGLP